MLTMVSTNCCENDVTVPALGQAAVSLLLVLCWQDDVGMVLQDRRIIVQRGANVCGVLVEDRVVGDDIENAALTMRRGMTQCIAQTGVSLAAAGRDGKRDDAGGGPGSRQTGVRDLGADAVDAAVSVQMRASEGLECCKQPLSARAVGADCAQSKHTLLQCISNGCGRPSDVRTCAIMEYTS